MRLFKISAVVEIVVAADKITFEEGTEFLRNAVFDFDDEVRIEATTISMIRGISDLPDDWNGDRVPYSNPPTELKIKEILEK
jgi:hypothetical protein